MRTPRVIWPGIMLVVGLAFAAPGIHGDTTAAPAAAELKEQAEIATKAGKWVSALNLGDAAKEARVKEAIVAHLTAVRDWHNQHPYTTVPAGISQISGQTLSQLDRQFIASSAIPSSVREALLKVLREELTPEQVESVLDQYTIGKVAFTLRGYKAIVPDLTPAEEAVILGYLKQAREQAIDFKNMNLISAVFEIYKTKCERHLYENGRNWKQLYSAYAKAQKAQKDSGSR